MTVPLRLPDLDRLLVMLGAAALAVAVAGAFTFVAYARGPALALGIVLAVAFVAVALVRPALGVAGALLAIPLELLDIQVAGGAISPAEAAFAFTGACWLARVLLWPGPVALPSARDLPVLVLLGALATGLVLHSTDAPRVLRVLVLWSLFSAVYLQVQSFSLKELRAVTASLVVGTGLLGAAGALSFDISTYADGSLTERASGTFQDPNYFASVLLLGLLAGSALMLSDPRRWLWLAIPLAGALLGLLASVSRGALAAFAVGLLVLLLWRRAQWIAVVLIAVFALTTAVGVNPILESERVTVVERRLATLGDIGSQTDLRPKLWDAAIGVGTEHPFFGVGWSGFEREANRRGVFEFRNARAIENAHSIPLSLLAETGVIGATAFLVWVFQLAARGARALRSRQREISVLALGLCASLIAFLLQGLTQMQLRVPVVAAAFFVVAGLLTRLADIAREEQPQPAAGHSFE